MATARDVLLTQFDHAVERLRDRMTGPRGDSGGGSTVEIPPMTEAEYLWSPVADAWTVRRRTDGPSSRAASLDGDPESEWGLDAARPTPEPPPFTTIAWRLNHLTEMLTGRADHVGGTRSLSRADYRYRETFVLALAAFDAATTAWHDAVAGLDDAALDVVGYCTFPHGSDREDPLSDILWWVNQEVLAHGAEIALLRDLYRDLPR